MNGEIEGAKHIMNPTSSPPNVIFFFTDQQRYDASGLHGNPLDLMPNFDRIARQSTHLSRLFTPQPVCGPARACLQTGEYATQIGCWRNGIPLPENAVTMAKCFREGGYKTGYIGKWHLASGEIGPVEPAARGGYDYWLASNVLEFTSDAYSTQLFNESGQPVQLPGYRVDALTDAAIRFVNGHTAAHPQQPFFLFLSFLEPHHQNHRDDYPAPDGYEERYAARWTPPDLQALGGSSARQLAGYWGMIKRLDEAFGRLIDALKSLHLLDDTIVVFASDHGNHFKTRNAEYKRSCHDASLRVPGLIAGPGFESGGEVGELVSLIDLPPTVLEACGLSIPETMQGRSLLPLLRREGTDWPEEVFAEISESQTGRCVRTQRWKYSVKAPDGSGSSKPGSDLYVEDCLYDLQSDPYELENLIGYESHHPVAEKLRARLLRRMREAGESEPEIISAPSRQSWARCVSEREVSA
jgi:arylsulfatase A-like enzyme